MQRRQRCQRLELAIDVIGQCDRAGIIRSAMNDAVAHSAQAGLAKTLLDEAEHVGEQMTAVRIRRLPLRLE